MKIIQLIHVIDIKLNFDTLYVFNGDNTVKVINFYADNITFK